MTEFVKTINKYVILLIVSSLFGVPWLYLRLLIFKDINPDAIESYIPTIVDYFIRLVTVVLLIIDFKKHNLKNVVVTCVGALFFPLLGIVILAIMLLEKAGKKANA
ncbi:MAG: hypothetical protein WCK02_12225 [Bacteroidota bacterium]